MFCYVTDTVAFILKIVALKDGRGSVLNMGAEHEIRTPDLAKIIIELTGSRS